MCKSDGVEIKVQISNQYLYMINIWRRASLLMADFKYSFSSCSRRNLLREWRSVILSNDEEAGKNEKYAVKYTFTHLHVSSMQIKALNQQTYCQSLCYLIPFITGLYCLIKDHLFWTKQWLPTWIFVVCNLIKN